MLELITAPKTQAQKEAAAMMEKAMRVLSLYERMKDRELVQHAMAADSYNRQTYLHFTSRAETCHKAAERIKRYFNNIISEIQL